MTNTFNRNDGTFAQVDMASLTPGLTTVTKATTANVALSSTASYFDGPSVSQGSSGTWYASGSITLQSTAGSDNFAAKLWDGSTVIASGAVTTVGASAIGQIALSGVIVSPAGNLKISASDFTGTHGNILFNFSGNSADSFITAVRIG
jgi:hypothetical protein